MAQAQLKTGTVPGTPGGGTNQELNRVLTFKDLLVYGMVFMVPIAPMGVYGMVSNESFGMVPLVYLVGIIAMVFTAFGYSQMSREFPVAGSVYSYVQRGLNPHIGFLAGWMILVDYILAPALLYAFGGIWINSLVPSIPIWVWVLAFVLFNTMVNGRGVALAAKTNFILLGIELIALLIFIGYAVKFVFIDGMGTGGLSLDPLFQSEHISLGFISTAASIAVLSFLGFDGISTLSEETKNPQKTVGKATVAALVILGLIFMVETYMAALIHPQYKGLDPDMGFFDIAKEAGGNFLYYLLILVNVVAVAIANALAAQSAISRILYSMSRDKLLPASGFFGKIHPRFKTPLNATVFVGVISLVVALSLSIETIIKFVNFGALTSFLLLNVTVFVYFFVKKKQRDTKGFFQYLLFPLCGFLIIGYVWSGFDKMTFVVGFSWLAVGVIVGAVKSKGYKEIPDSLKNLG
ncbi:APC family permease [Peribacillus deserti]|uniref:Amino acid permease n=1 Tax=Peribacillus deserti TaxID=673318 RepID=A0A2N5M4Z8_9BACI|nr:APC family permease [Peribacillus deserti]PLT29415.1 amino acid permease [Peribacillus deserti]